MKAENFDELQKKQDELRAERNKLTDEYRKQDIALQKQIDEIDLQKYGADKFDGKYIVINGDFNTVYIFVDHTERLFYGARFVGYGFVVPTSGGCISIWEELDQEVNYKKLYIINELSKDEYFTTLIDNVNKYGIVRK